MLAQQIFNGTVVGAVYALFSLGLTLIYGLFRILNLAHGAVFMWGAFIGYFAVTRGGLPLYVAFPVAILGAGCLSVVLDLLVFRPLRRREGEKRTGMVERFAAGFTDHGKAERVEHTGRELVAQRV